MAAIDHDVTLTFEGDPTAGMAVCSANEGSVTLTRLQERAYQALLLMKRTEFDAPLPWTDKPLYEWFVTTVKGVRFRTDIPLSRCCDPPAVINIAVPTTPTTVWETGFPGYPLEVMVHEARHVEGFWHTCQLTKDRTIGELGAFGAQYYMLIWLGAHSDLPSPYAQYALNRAEILRQGAFCDECR